MKARKWLWLVVVLTLFGAAWVGIAWLLTPDEVDTEAIEDGVAAGLRDELGGRYVVDCPDSMEWETGEEFHCFAEDQDGQLARITVSMENDDGEWSWIVG